ncbi:MAG: DUF3857 domain-containing protein [Chlorobi bacterium]|nr:DUF3857 domain-containing protein [Chlorobiota bacterium]
MEYYDKDSSADAVILCDYGRLDGYKIHFTRIIRIKILKKEGYKWANHVFRMNYKANVAGKTYNLENGKIVTSKLKSESIFKENVIGNIFNIRVAMPNVKVGSIIELKFDFPGMPNEWYFQFNIPVKHSELRIEYNQYIKYQKYFLGLETLDIVEPYRWVAIDVPALKREPYIDNLNNYLTKFEFEITSIFFPGETIDNENYTILKNVYFNDISSSWEQVNTQLLDHSNFGNSLAAHSLAINKIVDFLESGNLKQNEKLKYAYERVKQIKWNNNKNIYISSISGNFDKILKEKYGNSADINITLIKLLKSLNFEVYPVVLSTIDNGKLSHLYPSINKFNYVIALVKLNNKTILLDATDEYLPYGMLPERCLNGQGRIIDKINSGWIDIKPKSKNKQIVYYDLFLNDSLNTLEGKLNYNHIDYNAYNFRKNYYKFNSQEEYINGFKDKNTGLTINNYKINNLDNIYLPIDENYEVSINNMVTKIDSDLIIYPLLYEQLKENPFKLESRKMPVYFPYKKDYTFILKLEIPDGYFVKDIPKSVKITLPDKSASFIYNISYTNNLIQLSYKLNINKETFSNDEDTYKSLKAFYNQIVTKHNQPIILTKRLK